MTNRAQRGAVWRASRLKASASDEVTYTRGGDSLAGLLAVIGKTSHDSVTGNGMMVVVESVDFVITAADLILGEAVRLPATGDRITWNGDTFEVLPFGESKEHWRYSDPHRVTIRIHTKKVA